MPDVNPLPVSEETREALQAVRGAEQSYDELLQQLVVEHHRFERTETLCAVEERDVDELVPIDDV